MPPTRLLKGGNSPDYQLMFLGDVDAFSTIVDQQALVFDEASERFKPASNAAFDASISAALAAAASPTALNPFATFTLSQMQTYQQASAANYTLMKIEPYDSDALDFYFHVWTDAQAGRDNVGWNFGYNNKAIGGPQGAADAAFYLQMETHYNPTADPVFEYHLNAYTANGSASTRPFQINVYKDDLNTVISESFDSLTWEGRSGTPQLMTVLASTTAALSQWVCFTPLHIRNAGDVLHIEKANGTAVIVVETDTPAVKFTNTDGYINSNTTGKVLYFQNWSSVQIASTVWLQGATTYVDGNMQIADAKNIILNTTTGTKIGTSVVCKLAFWDSTPVVQQILATGAGATVDNVITLLQTLGLCRQS